MSNNTNHSSDAKRIAKNTLLLYFRSIIVMVVSIYTSRVVLATLGIDDYGIYNVVGGVVGMFSMLSATFVSASQRFISFALGRNDAVQTQKVFTISLNIHIGLAVILLVLMETIGLWYLNSIMKIPEDRLTAANWVFQFSILSFLCNLISIPYNALIISKEKMGVFAYVSIYEVIMKLLVVYLLQLAHYDKLVFYAILIFSVSLSIRLFYGFYCSHKFSEVHRIKVHDKDLYKDFLQISGWNFFGSCASIMTLQGINLVLNFFCGVAVNAAKGVASQIENAVTTLVNNFQTSLNPQIVKSYAQKDYDFLKSLISSGTRISFFLMLFLSLPFLWTAPDILHVWLKNPPEYSEAFVRMILIYILIIPFNSVFDKVLLATGKIKRVQVMTSFVTLMNIPLSIIVLYMRLPPYSVYFVYILMGLINFVIKLWNTLRYFPEMKLGYYCSNVLLKALGVVIISQLLPIAYSMFLYNHTFMSWVCFMLIIEMSLVLCIYILGVTEKERGQFKKFLAKKIHR